MLPELTKKLTSKTQKSAVLEDLEVWPVVAILTDTGLEKDQYLIFRTNGIQLYLHTIFEKRLSETITYGSVKRVSEHELEIEKYKFQAANGIDIVKLSEMIDALDGITQKYRNL